MHTYSYDISDQQILRDFDPKSHQSSLEVTRGQIKFVNCNQGPNFWHTYPYYISDPHQSELEYFHGCTIGTATNSELGHEKLVI